MKHCAEITISQSSVLSPAQTEMNLMSSRTNKLLINYNPNNEIANRLRVERQRRLDSWGAAKHNILKQTKSLGIWQASHSYDPKIEVQVRISEELYKFVHIFETEESQGLIFVESVGSRRIIEVPDVDSSILSRAPSRAITPIGKYFIHSWLQLFST